MVGIIMGSESDLDTMNAAREVLRTFDVPYEIAVVSAHRTPERMVEYAKAAADRGLKVIIAGAGGAAHLPGMISSMTLLPVLGVPMQTQALQGLDSLLSIVQMPGGIPTATFAIGASGAKNAAIFAVRILALDNDALRAKLQTFEIQLQEEALRGHDRVVATERPGG